MVYLWITSFITAIQMRAVLIGKITVKKLLSNNLQTLLEILLCQILHGKIKDKTPFPTVIDVDSIQVGSISQQTKTKAMNTNINQNVNGVNLLNKYCLDELRNILPQLQNYVGKRILTQSGRSAKFNIEHTKQNNFRCYLDISRYSIWLNCDVCTQDKPDKNGISCSTYFKKNIYLGEMLNTGELKSVQDVETIAKNNNLDKLIVESEVLEQIKQHKELLSKADYIKTNFPLDANLLKY